MTSPLCLRDPSPTCTTPLPCPCWLQQRGQGDVLGYLRSPTALLPSPCLCLPGPAHPHSHPHPQGQVHDPSLADHPLSLGSEHLEPKKEGPFFSAESSWQREPWSLGTRFWPQPAGRRGCEGGLWRRGLTPSLLGACCSLAPHPQHLVT